MNKKIAIILQDNKDANSIIEKLETFTNNKYDIFIINNCEEIKSKYVNIKLNKKVSFPNDIIMGLHYSDTFKIIKKTEYVAYCFINVNGDTLIFYNGNNYGEEGIFCAKLEI